MLINIELKHGSMALSMGEKRQVNSEKIKEDGLRLPRDSYSLRITHVTLFI